MKAAPKIVCIIQARMGSTRLPGKSLMPLGLHPLLGNVLERAKLASMINEVVLATTALPVDDPIAALGQEFGVAVFRGHPTDLVHRYHHAAIAHKADIVVRIPADNPLIHPSEVDRIIRYFLTANVDFASNLTPFLDNQYPDGLGGEVFSRELLEWEYNEVTDFKYREHVTNFFRENPQRFKLGSVMCPEGFRRPDVILDIDTIADYNFMKRLFDALTRPGKLIHITEIIPWYDVQIPKRTR